MMINPPLSDLLKKIDNRYILVNVTAKRARMLNQGTQPLTSKTSTKDVVTAINEINEGKIRYRKIKRSGSTQ
ncbi:DNA-directed RNA polymerase subunit omega [Thermoclostridium stercorarium subsp. thermolacticum DSM 2910]|uniref:DNA-directed RNA polymerase subunit omega n=2 Tax=Thermoclostridium stercorarium TaxID=1510 RepID=A0A1B1YMF2_THEST|nr:DNA-directed RNA polymerase subunit omega [Thermoclostridium stercorarium]AGI39974.1 DNA-directed RNA polymerase omega subunit [Thermoclostridium stercorarium subsp. stercorarium DSM 8532]ANW99294.1 DNA-directed RNA polymerase subunit omega [Thermoclostridium stercorarium subsp. thermolacticum DSM 2910]ANX01923.1 DNA-directed RNA polymerase subunit omega [Thermoclostridium stercorarium subsp. leptospartum DSM 9219]UZQ84965.1 DNA-directed RNA polymerase subunit omega [Thermoclostridium sterco